MEQTGRYPGIAQAIGLLGLTFLLMIAVSIPVVIVALVVADRPPTEHPAVIAVTNLVAIGLILIWGIKKAGASRREVFPIVPVDRSLLLPMALTTIGAGLLLSELDNLFRTLFPIPALLADFFMGLMSGRTSRLWSFAALVIVAPLTEELLFRGLILRGFLSRYTVRKAVCASALLFGLFHLNPWQFFGATALGVLFAWWFVNTGSLLPCLFGHALNNAVPFIFLAVLPVEIPGFTSSPTEVAFHPPWLDLAGLLLAGSGIWLTTRKFGEGGGAPPELPREPE